MQRVYYCKEKINDEYILECATFSFSDEEFELSISAYKNNDEIGILRWNNYLKEFENKFLDFRKI